METYNSTELSGEDVITGSIATKKGARLIKVKTDSDYILFEKHHPTPLTAFASVSALGELKLKEALIKSKKLPSVAYTAACLEVLEDIGNSCKSLGPLIETIHKELHMSIFSEQTFQGEKVAYYILEEDRAGEIETLNRYCFQFS